MTTVLLFAAALAFTALGAVLQASRHRIAVLFSRHPGRHVARRAYLKEAAA